MLVTTGIICVVFGLVGFGGQLLSAVSWPLAQRLGLQERDDVTDALFRRLERNTARWDLLVLWTLPACGALMIVDHPAWPIAALVAGPLHVDTAGRELAKVLGLRAEGVAVGSAKSFAVLCGLFASMAAIGLWISGYGLATLI